MAVNKDIILKIQKEIGSATLVAATKYASVQDLIELNNSGIKIFGENRVQSFLEKYKVFPDPSHWHMIGTLQSNKVKYIIDKVSMIHSVSSISLMNEIQKQAVKHNLIMPILIQVNIAHEESKHGFYESQVEDAINYLQKECPNIELNGFMMMAPKIDKEKTRVYFRALRNLSEKMQKEFPNLPIKELSMGMSNDYDIAVQEGATMVRIGRKLFTDLNI